MKEISAWFAEVGLKVAQQENANPRCSAREFLQRYVFVMLMKFSLVVST